MAVKIRLARRGRKKLALYDIVVADASAPRDGRFIEKLGNYNPNTSPATILLKEESAMQWLLKGAQPTNTVRNLLSAQGILLKKHLQVGVNKGALTQEEADKKLGVWKQEKENKITKKAEKATEVKQPSKATTVPKKQATAPDKKKIMPKPEEANQTVTTEKTQASSPAVKTAPSSEETTQASAAAPENPSEEK